MPEINEAMLALKQFHEALGEDATRYVNYRDFLQRRDVLELIKPRIEYQISRYYLPGFRFTSLAHLGWHLSRERYYLRYITGERIPPSHFSNFWIRRFIMPTRYDYLCEVAHALRSRYAMSREFARMPGAKNEAKSWVGCMRKWLFLDVEVLGFESDRRQPSHWRERHGEGTESSIHRWARQALARREKRHQSSPSNYWYLDTILYSGGKLENIDLALESVGLVNTGYLEIWKWMGPDGVPAPEDRSIPCITPASPESWATHDRKFKVED